MVLNIWVLSCDTISDYAPMNSLWTNAQKTDNYHNLLRCHQWRKRWQHDSFRFSVRFHMTPEISISFGLDNGFCPMASVHHQISCVLDFSPTEWNPMHFICTSPWYLHPCEKVIGIFFRQKFFTIYFLLFVLIFVHNICDVVNIKSTDFCCISIFGYPSVTFWKRLLGQNPMSH